MTSAENAQSSRLAHDIFVIHLEGDFDLSERSRLADAFNAAASAAIVVVDFERTTFIDSTVLGCLVTLLAATERRGARLMLVHLPPTIDRLLKITSLKDRFEIKPQLSAIYGNGTPGVVQVTLVSQSQWAKRDGGSRE
jgi:anti-anti-sigma factor